MNHRYASAIYKYTLECRSLMPFICTWQADPCSAEHLKELALAPADQQLVYAVNKQCSILPS